MTMRRTKKNIKARLATSAFALVLRDADTFHFSTRSVARSTELVYVPHCRFRAQGRMRSQAHAPAEQACHALSCTKPKPRRRRRNSNTAPSSRCPRRCLRSFWLSRLPPPLSRISSPPLSVSFQLLVHGSTHAQTDALRLTLTPSPTSHSPPLPLTPCPTPSRTSHLAELARAAGYTVDARALTDGAWTMRREVGVRELKRAM
ncbi:hypothetical protein C8R47DRAFT_1209363 [Mycena vitilis]|nr:hypothetical protein C8R47DRAFT_1209363 [Mycena vitilis]